MVSKYKKVVVSYTYRSIERNEKKKRSWKLFETRAIASGNKGKLESEQSRERSNAAISIMGK